MDAIGIRSDGYIDTVVYYLKDYEMGIVEDKRVPVDSTYYKIYFTAFSGGMTDGKYTFMQEEIWLTSAEVQEAPGLALQVYPNPATDYIQVVFDIYGRADIDIVDMTGRIVYSRAYEASGFTNLSLDLSHLNPGVFFVRVGTEERSDVIRFIKE